MTGYQRAFLPTKPKGPKTERSINFGLFCGQLMYLTVRISDDVVVRQHQWFKAKMVGMSAGDAEVVARADLVSQRSEMDLEPMVS